MNHKTSKPTQISQTEFKTLQNRLARLQKEHHSTLNTLSDQIRKFIAAQNQLKEHARLFETLQKISYIRQPHIDPTRDLEVLATQIVQAVGLRSLMIALVNQAKTEVTVIGSYVHNSLSNTQTEHPTESVLLSQPHPSPPTYSLNSENVTAITARLGKLQIIKSPADPRLDAQIDKNPEDWNDKIAYFIPIPGQGHDTVAVLATASHKQDELGIIQRIQAFMPLWTQTAAILSDIRVCLKNNVAPPQTPLTKREEEVLTLIATGKTSREIANALCLSIRTIEDHRRNLMSKLAVHTIAGLTQYAIRYQIISID